MQTQYARYTKEQLEGLAKQAAQLRLIGHMYVGHIEEPTVRWADDGSIEIFINHQPAPLPLSMPGPAKTKRRYTKRAK